MTPRVLVFEPDFAGHRQIYIDAVAQSAKAFEGRVEVIIAHHEKVSVPHGVRSVTLESMAGQSSRGRFKFALALARLHACSEVLLLYGDQYLLELSVHAMRRQTPAVSFVLFRFEQHLPAQFRRTGRAALKDALKSWWLRALSRRARGSMLLLEPWAAEHFRRDGAGGVCFAPEPVRGATQPAPVEHQDRVFTVGIFGVIDARKAVSHLADAMWMRGNKSRLLIIGPVKPEFRPVIAGLMRRDGDVEVVCEDRHYSEDEIPALLRRCDAVSVLYGAQHVGMSSILAWAAMLDLPVIGFRRGLIGWLIQSYSLGACADDARPEMIAQALNTCAARFSRDGAERFRIAMRGFEPQLFLQEYFTDLES